MNIKTFFFALALLAPFLSGGQTIIMDETVGADTTLKPFGKNRKHFVTLYVWGGYYVDAFEGEAPLDPTFFRSGESGVGLMYKRKWNELMSSVVTFDYNALTAGAKRRSDTMRHQLTGHLLGLGYHQRFSFSKRGDHYGLFAEIGINGELRVGESIRIFNRQADGEMEYRKKDTRITGTRYFNDLNYNLMAKMGYNGFSVYGRYRMMPLIRDEYAFDFPKITAGVIWDLAF